MGMNLSWEFPAAVAVTLMSDDTYTFDSKIKKAGYDSEAEMYYITVEGATTLFSRECVAIFSVKESGSAEIVEFKPV
jgi:hypothetical protein